jgi:hypothetical protein
MDPRICAASDPRPDIPNDAGIVRPPKGSPFYGPALRYFGWVEDVGAWGDRGWALVAIARERCADLVSSQEGN